jgi:hypothetical protein
MSRPNKKIRAYDRQLTLSQQIQYYNLLYPKYETMLENCVFLVRAYICNRHASKYRPFLFKPSKKTGSMSLDAIKGEHQPMTFRHYYFNYGKMLVLSRPLIKIKK